jgi:hypothetical protein
VRLKSKAAARAQWMREFERLVNAWRPGHAGRIDWATAAHLYDSGKGAVAAATSYTRTLPDTSDHGGEAAFLIHVN